MKESAPVTHICQVCKKPKSPHEGQIAELIRPSLLEFIKKQMPEWNGKGFICFDDLGKFRKEYVKDVLEDEIGELSALDHEVIESLQQHEILSSDLSKHFKTKADLWPAPVRPDRLIWRELAIYHSLRSGAVWLDHPERHFSAESRIRSISVHSFEFDPLLPRRDSSADHHDEPEPRRGARSFACGERLQDQPQSGIGNPASARKNRSPVAAAIQSAVRDSADPDRITRRTRP